MIGYALGLMIRLTKQFGIMFIFDLGWGFIIVIDSILFGGFGCLFVNTLRPQTRLHKTIIHREWEKEMLHSLAAYKVSSGIEDYVWHEFMSDISQGLRAWLGWQQ